MKHMSAIICSTCSVVVALGICLGAALFTPIANGQSANSKLGAVPIRSDFAKKRAAYQNAYDDLAKGDPSLEKELLTGDPNEILKRIDAQAGRAQRFTAARVELYQTMRSTLGSHLRDLAPGAKVNPDEIRSTIQTGIRAVSEETDTLEKDIEGAKDPAMRLALVKQKELLTAIQQNLIKQQVSLDKVKESGEQADAAFRQVRESMQSLVTELSSAEERANSIGAQYSRYYAELKSSVEKNPVPKPSPLVGVWRWKTSPMSIYPVVSFEVRITSSTGQLHGHLIANYRIPPDKKFPPSNLVLDFEGKAAAGTVKCPFNNGILSGDIVLTISGQQLVVVVNIAGDDVFNEYLDRVPE